MPSIKTSRGVDMEYCLPGKVSSNVDAEWTMGYCTRNGPGDLFTMNIRYWEEWEDMPDYTFHFNLTRKEVQITSLDYESKREDNRSMTTEEYADLLVFLLTSSDTKLVKDVLKFLKCL
jgi:hypothetical protein